MHRNIQLRNKMKRIDTCVECGKDMLVDDDIENPVCDECPPKKKKEKSKLKLKPKPKPKLKQS